MRLALFLVTAIFALPSIAQETSLSKIQEVGRRPPPVAEPLRRAESLEQMLKGATIERLAKEIRDRGDPVRGALLYFKSSAACARCHLGEAGGAPLGPNLSDLAKEIPVDRLTDKYILDALLYPSKDIRDPYKSVSFLTVDGQVLVGMVDSENDSEVVVRSTSDYAKHIRLNKSNIEERNESKQSIMPEGLISSFKEQADFLDLAAYVFSIVRGGRIRANELQPTAEQLAIKEDWLDLDHAGILKRLSSKDFESGKAIYHGYCVDCHGIDGNRPNLPTARAFGNQSLKFGADPYQMFMTLSKGNGLMGPMSHLSPHQRYEVVHYIREAFMKPTNPEYEKVTSRYLESLPKGSDDGTFVPIIEREFGPALGSQLDRNYESVLTTKVGQFTVCYDLHTMNQAGVWREGFLDLSSTQHALSRGEGNATRKGRLIPGLQAWEWAHEADFDYPRETLPPRGPMPSRWMDYQGYYLHKDRLILSYEIDKRPILESAASLEEGRILQKWLEIGPGKKLRLACAAGDNKALKPKWVSGKSHPVSSVDSKEANGMIVTLEDPSKSDREVRTAIAVVGDVKDFVWQIDSANRIVLNIPASDSKRNIQILYATQNENSFVLDTLETCIRKLSTGTTTDLSDLTKGGDSRWPEVLSTRGYLGLERGAYVLDTLAIPSSNPWNSWFRTTALDFLSDGRMVVSTYGGEIWIVSGVDQSLRNMQWKRFASGLYEPMGVKVVNDQIYVTCKDRVHRLHDFDFDDEADFYESFSADTDVSIHFHAFNFDLQTDDEGNFYYAKCGHGADYLLPGAVIKIAPNGQSREVLCTGFRVPNGMGSIPGVGITCSDNQGQWMPASKINLVKKNGFYGWVPTYDGKGKWSADGGKIDIKKIVPPKSFEKPLVWLPHSVDNSSGGQVWVDDPRWGPLSGRLLHTSFGKGWLSYLMIQNIENVSQAAVVRLPFDFRTGIMRGRVNPKDGQLYVTGLQGWNGSGRPGLMDQGIQRIRYTGKPWPMISEAKVEGNGLRIHFSFTLDPDSLKQGGAIQAEHWNYLWQSTYGSEMYSPTTKKIGPDKLTLEYFELSDDRQSLLLHFKDLQPVDQLHLQLNVASEDGVPFVEEVYWTIHKIPSN
jgi:putative heme-binding domain-containing protein